MNLQFRPHLKELCPRLQQLDIKESGHCAIDGRAEFYSTKPSCITGALDSTNYLTSPLRKSSCCCMVLHFAGNGKLGLNSGLCNLSLDHKVGFRALDAYKSHLYTHERKNKVLKRCQT